ncbi:Ribonuclease VapC [uncultured Pleomorphomonas sp.]|uniref:Ribonuclease VapC n=2 Tax=Pleomorphomonas TaxID=261933 RepID=A0A2G9WS33_9HYPH|nr:type II toxin-antitoxin system VapC family toxin [Pleomorphomonas carboxyditropha]PIO97518.1 VapC toxin family PIN domain ribonuclease [Pleomorphomonas carboxyditropha]SCM78730.1 Ribonuclease VapC [uncultured Pleomorphomonas sp.]
MRGWLLDTNVISELRKPRPDANVKAFIADQPGDTLFLSDITFAEIRFGIERLDDASRRADLNLWLDRTMRPLFAGRVLSIGEDIILRWKMLHVAGQKRGHTFSQPDLFIAAMAVVEDLVVVSRDTSEFIAADVPVFDPWSLALHARGKSFRVAAPVTLETLPSGIRRRTAKP